MLKLATILILALCSAQALGALRMYNGEAYAPTPQGYMLARCMREVPSGTHVTEKAGRVVAILPSNEMIDVTCERDAETPLLLPREAPTASVSGFPTSYDGWQAYTTYEYPDGLDVFLGNISTPKGTPEMMPEVLFIFTGLQNVDWIPKVDPEPKLFDIVQPVLQYPATAVLSSDERLEGTDGQWGVRSWYVTLKAGALYSKVALLNEGDVVFGNMTRTGDETFYVGSVNTANGETVSISATNERLRSQPWAYNTLETYGAPNCNYLPNAPSFFTDLILAKGNTVVTPQWVNHLTPDVKCPGNKCVIVDPATVTIDMGQ